MGEKRKLGEMLLKAGLVDEFQLRRALSEQRQWRRPLGVTLVSMGLVRETELIRVLSEQLGYPTADLDAKIVAPEVVELVPYEIATKHCCLPLAVRQKGPARELYLAIFDPTDLAAIDDIGFRTGHEVRPVLVGDQQLKEAIQRSYRTGDAHGLLKQVSLEDIAEPGAPIPRACHAAAEPTPLATPSLELEWDSSVSPPLAPVDEGELVLGEEPPAPREAPSALNPESRRYLLQALVQLLISEGVVDPDKLLRTIQSLAGETD